MAALWLLHLVLFDCWVCFLGTARQIRNKINNNQNTQLASKVGKQRQGLLKQNKHRGTEKSNKMQ